MAPDRRFDVQLFIVHPSLDPAEISAALRLEPMVTHRVGDRRATPRGTPLPGTYPDTRWRYSVRHQVTDQWFVDGLGELLALIVPHKAFLDQLRASGGRAGLIIQFLGDGYFGDTVPHEVLSKLAELGLDLGIECFTVPQS